MKHIIIRYCLAFFALVAVGYPLWVRISSLSWGADGTLLPNIFPLFGITAFVLLWLHSLCGVFEPWLRRYIPFDRFVSVTAAIILACLIMHPLLLLIIFNFNLKGVYATYGFTYVLLGTIGWLLLITYDITKPLKKYHDFFARNWNKVLIISNVGFLLTFFHSILIGSDLQSGLLRTVWIFYGITAILAIAYTYGIKKLLKR